MDPFHLPRRRASIALMLVLYILEYQVPLVYEQCKHCKWSIFVDATIRIDHTTLQGCTSSHTLSPLIALYTSCTSATFKRKPDEGVSHDLTNQQVSSPGLSPIRVPPARKSGWGYHYSPKRCVQGSQAHQTGGAWYTRPWCLVCPKPTYTRCHLVDY